MAKKKKCKYVADGELHNVREWYLENTDMPKENAKRIPKSWFEYEVWLIDKKTGKMVDMWDTIFDAGEGTALNEKQAQRALDEILDDVNNKCKWKEWFTVR